MRIRAASLDEGSTNLLDPAWLHRGSGVGWPSALSREAVGPLCEVDEKGNEHVHRTAVIGTLHRSEINPGERRFLLPGFFSCNIKLQGPASPTVLSTDVVNLRARFLPSGDGSACGTHSAVAWDRWGVSPICF